MICYACDTELKHGTNTYFIELEKCMLIIKNVPCYKCEHCGEVFYSDEVTERLNEIITQVRNFVTEIAVLEYTDSKAA